MTLGELSPLERAASSAFLELAVEVRRALEPRLRAWLASRLVVAGRASVDAETAAGAVVDLSLRGGKRLRPALVAAAYDACSAADEGQPSWMPAMPAMLAIELLQTYLLIHDDWMDDDAVRRGGPSVHVHLRERVGERALGDAMAILAGDLACGYAQSALLEAEVPEARVLRAARAFARIQEEVVLGQMAEMCAGRSRTKEVPSLATVHSLKTASYTVVGPLALGASLAGAKEDRLVAFERFGRPLGIAFQLRDDVLGTFGDPARTGKPVGSDLRQGKRTALIDALSDDPVAREKVGRVLGRADASDEEVSEAARIIEASSARARVEARIEQLLAEARGELAAMEDLGARGRAALEGAVTVLGERSA